MRLSPRPNPNPNFSSPPLVTASLSPAQFCFQSTSTVSAASLSRKLSFKSYAEQIINESRNSGRNEGKELQSLATKGYGRRGGALAQEAVMVVVYALQFQLVLCRGEDLRRPFGQFGPLKDIYLPRDYYTGEPRGFGFVQYVDPADAAEAKYQMDGQILHGRELTVVFAEENRKKPSDMRARERGRGRFYDRRRSPLRYSRSPPPRHARSPSRGRDYYSPSPKRRQYSRSVSPQDRRYSRDRSYTPDGRRRSYTRSPPYNGSRSRSQSPIRGESPSRLQSRSPDPEDYPREAVRDRSPSE
ncbi:Serine/arginine-rich SC35-like splicing factor SCL30A [Vitis vinifera]|uniref:Serine/arginine-rich SC35-like splicing factor SCL30A n=1 Tax=Vitis vinifera TaxID=29760 RepID=A0A438JV81_VITVI|nr:Serine/arginine-rich SC35-like splicing factor SCL30A [Vitis vinifera]